MRMLLPAGIASVLLLLLTGGPAFAEGEADEGSGEDSGGGTDEGSQEPGSQGEGEPPPPWEQTPAPAATTAAPAPVDDIAWATDISRLKGGGPVGLGFVLGSNNGFSLKIWPAQAHGIVLHLGVPGLLNSLGVGLSYRIHFKPIVVPGSPVALHVQAGPAFRARLVFRPDTIWTELGGGAVLGLSIAVRDVPAELFFEVAPTVAGAVNPAGQGIGFDVEGLVGVRFYPG